MPNPPTLLDLYSGQGGAAEGYRRAGFRVVAGVDTRPQPRYPFPFIHDDALAFLARADLSGVDLIHASPPCQHYSVATRARRERYPDLLPSTREALERTGRPWVIENVPGAPMRADIVLCGCQVGLARIKRERWFETSWRQHYMWQRCRHGELSVPIVGHGMPGPARKALGRDVGTDEAKALMGCEWMTRAGLSQAIPPGYTELVGGLFLARATSKAVL
jgi:DNA (cytosine-5)-methyltransferase 1